MKTFRSSFFLLVICTLSSCAGRHQASRSDAPSLIDHWLSGGSSELVIHTDLDKLLTPGDQETYQPALIGWDGQSFESGLRTRGITRSKICAFPPLKLNFKKEDLEAAGFDPRFDKIKLVTECTGDRDLLLREYLAYRLYEQMTPYSFRTSLARVRYIDSEGRSDTLTQYAILLEPEEEMAERIGGQVLSGEQNLRAIDAKQYCLLTVFQYMIGNTDWNLSRSHNIRLIQLGESAPLPIPYDFDYAGLVNAPYAVTYDQLPIDSVRERFFQYRGKNNDGLALTLQAFQSEKESLLRQVEALESLSPEARQDARTYLESFFEIIETPSLLESKLFVKVSNSKDNIS